MSHPFEGHPCADHIATCDHCALCEAGVCCAGLSAQQRAELEAQVQPPADQLRQAIASEAATTWSLADRLRGEARCPDQTLPAAQRLGLGAAVDVSVSHSRKEAMRVLAARSAR